MMEIKVQKFKLFLKFRLIDLSDIFFCENNLSLLCIRQQIHDKYFIICREQIIKVIMESSFCHLRASCYSYTFNHSFLFPKYRNRPTNHHIAENDILYLYNLFRFNEIGYVSSVIYASSVISGSTSHVTSS